MSCPCDTELKQRGASLAAVIILLLGLLLPSALFLTACASKTAQQGGPVIFAVPTTNQVQAMQGAAVFFTGDVKLNSVPWHEGLTLAEAIIQAQYTGYSDPFSITLTRNGLGYRIDVRRLLRGEENPLLEPGDRINVRR
jgi:hypothetical protein